ncbi:MAG TPA: flavodoxin domain-containing protein [Acetobacteraceae bacterium]|nr:flavodoxin domain-containing protein [Acetobacteraceae bacterium]
MAIQAAAVQAAPFAEDQLGAIDRLLAGASAEQLQWLSGYVAGFHAARLGRPAPAPAPAAPVPPPAAKAPLTILYATESGNAEALAASARKAAARLGFAAKVLDMADATPAEAAKAGNLLIIASTWGEGDPPQRAEAFYAALMEDDAPSFGGVRFAVLALGDRAYANFCETGRRFDERLAALGGERVAERIDCDLDYEAPAKAWLDARLGDFAPRGEQTAVIHVDFARAEAAEPAFTRARPFAAEIASMVNLNSSRSTAETWHVELSLEGAAIAYEPGDSLGVLPCNDPALVDEVLRAAGLEAEAALRSRLTDALDITTLSAGQIAAYAALTGDAEVAALAADPARSAAFLRDRQLIDLLSLAPVRLSAEQLTGLLRPLPPRYYSVASSRALVGEEAHLLVSAVRWESHGRQRRGVASIDIAERRKPGERLRLFLKPNPHFRLPTDDRPIVMVGPGTGVAPFRGFLQEREATGAKGRSWLFFGARQFTHDFLYQLEFQDWLKSGVLSRMDVAFSRDQPEKIYVQTRMWEARRELFAWIADGAAIYVCGDASAMAKDVHATLLRIVADQGGMSEDAAVAYVRGLQQSGRYLRDVY